MEKLSHRELHALFLKILNPDDIIADAESQRPYQSDGLSMYREQTLFVLIPNTVAEVQSILALCHRHQVPVVARGAGTGLSGGAMPHPDGVVLSMAKFNRILNIDPDSGTACVEPGVRNLYISEQANNYGLYYAPDPSSQIACTIGGNVAENSGGVHCLKYGLTVHNILKLEMLTVEGEQLTIGSDGLDTNGFDLLALLTGSEGLLGIVTEVTVKLLPLPEKAQLVMAGFANVRDAANAVSAVISQGIIPAGLEMMDSHAIVAAEDYCHAGYPRDAKALLLCELDGTREEVEEYIGRVEQVFKDNNATSTSISQTEEQRALLWQGRKAAFPAVGRISPDYYCMDGTIPRSQLAYVLEEMEKMSQQYDLRIANVFHAGDGNLHPLILFDAKIPGQFAKTEELGGKILELCVRVGGCITGEHGVGIEKLRQMPAQFNHDELLQFNGIKNAFDHHGLLNPGKGIPLLKRCQEYRALNKEGH